MRLRWTRSALSDLVRLHEFLSQSAGREISAAAVRKLTAGPEKLLQTLRMGRRLDTYKPREVRRIFLGRYEIRYEVHAEAIDILRIWHTLEDR